MKKAFKFFAAAITFFAILFIALKVQSSLNHSSIEIKEESKINSNDTQKNKELNFSNYSSNYYQESEPFVNSSEIGKDQYKDTKILICEFAVKAYLFEHESIKYVALISDTDFFTCMRYEKAKEFDNDLVQGNDYILKSGKWTNQVYELQRRNITWNYPDTFTNENVKETIDLMIDDIELYELNIDRSDTIEV